MTGGYDAVSDATFRARVEAERDWTREQVELLWKSMSKRRGELAALAERTAQDHRDLERTLANFVKWVAAGVLTVLFGVVRAKLGL